MFQKLIFKPRSKSNKNCIKETAKNKKKKKTKGEKDAEDPKILDDREQVEKEEEKNGDERVSAAEAEAARGRSETLKGSEERCEEDGKIDEGMEVSTETVIKKPGGAETKDKGAENGAEGGEGKIAPDGEGSKENGEPLENGEVKEVTETFATVEAQSETKDKEGEGVAEVEAVMENGVETDEERDEEDVIKSKTEEEADVEVAAKEAVVAEPEVSNQE